MLADHHYCLHLGSMDLESVDLEERLKSFLIQLQNEYRILDRIVYKGKNQHRRCFYFQYIMKVRRDVKLLLSAGLQEMLGFLFQIINEKKPTKTVNLLESLKRRKCNTENNNYQERLLGVARLLLQMVEPMVKAAIEISSLLARSFFMGFSVTILAILGRLRVLVQQMLLDVVSVFNMISSLSQKEHSVKLNRHGIEVIREFYPSNDELVTLECVWEKDKFVLLEKVNKIEIKNRETDLQSSNIKYQTIEAFLGLGDDEPGYMKIDTDNSIEEHPDLLNIDRQKSAESVEPPMNISTSTMVELQEPIIAEGGNEKSFDKSSVIDKDAIPCPSPKSPQPKLELKRKVAFISIGNPKVTQTSESSLLNNVPTANLLPTDKTREDLFFSLLTAGNVKDSLF